MLALALLMLSHVAEVSARGRIYTCVRGYRRRHPHHRYLVESAGAASVVDVTAFGAKPNDPLNDNAQVKTQLSRIHRKRHDTIRII